MSTNPIVVSVIDAGVKLFKSRLAPAVLGEDQKTINAISAWLIQNGYDVRTMTSPEQFSDAMYKATNALLFEKDALRWVVKPKKLVLYEQEGRAQIQKSQTASQQEFVDKVKADEAATAQKKVNEAALKEASQLIDSVSIVKHGKVMHGQTETVKVNLRKKLASANDDNAVEVSRNIKQLVADLYESLERGQERL